MKSFDVVKIISLRFFDVCNTYGYLVPHAQGHKMKSILYILTVASKRASERSKQKERVVTGYKSKGHGLYGS